MSSVTAGRCTAPSSARKAKSARQRRRATHAEERDRVDEEERRKPPAQVAEPAQAAHEQRNRQHARQHVHRHEAVRGGVGASMAHDHQLVQSGHEQRDRYEGEEHRDEKIQARLHIDHNNYRVLKPIGMLGGTTRETIDLPLQKRGAASGSRARNRSVEYSLPTPSSYVPSPDALGGTRTST